MVFTILVILADSKGLKHTPIISGNENADMDCEQKGRKLVDKCCFEQFCGPSPSTSTCTPVPEGICFLFKVPIKTVLSLRSNTFNYSDVWRLSSVNPDSYTTVILSNSVYL